MAQARAGRGRDEKRMTGSLMIVLLVRPPVVVDLFRALRVDVIAIVGLLCKPEETAVLIIDK